MGWHFVEDQELLGVVRQALPPGRHRDATSAAIERWLERQPTAPRLVGTTKAAEILGVQPPHVTRLREQGRMPEPLDVEGSVTVYVRAEVEALGDQLAEERRRRMTARSRKQREEEKV